MSSSPIIKMTYQEVLDKIYAALPAYQREGKAAYKADLGNIVALCEELNHPEKNFKSIHVAGTNGKGSTSHMLASVLQEQGYKVGLYTSPHLIDFSERVKINGVNIEEQFVIEFYNKFNTLLEKIEPSFFEFSVALAFWHFSNQKVDFAIIEVGLGGRLDSTNIITPELSIVTNISLDHTHLLGDTIEKIALEKGGIIKENIPVIIGKTENKAEKTLIGIAQSKNASYTLVRQKEPQTLPSDFSAQYQLTNQQTVLCAIEKLQALNFKIDQEAIERGLLSISKNTSLLGRWQILEQSPKVICDVGHNEAGINEVLKQLKTENFDQLHIVWGMVNDKDISQILQLLPKDANYYFTQPSIFRKLPVDELYESAQKIGLKGKPFTSVLQAVENAKLNLKANDLLLIGGSTFVVADVFSKN